MKISSIQPFKGKTLRLDFEEGDPVFINADIAAQFHLKAGTELPQAALEEIISANNIRRAKERALYLLDIRDYSYVEMFKKLSESYSEDICYEVLNKLAELGCINDRRYAERWAEHLCVTKKFGYYKAREELKKRGLPGDIIEEALEPYKDNCSERIAELIRKKYAKYLLDESDEKAVSKVKAALARMGYSYSEINQAIKSFYDEEE